MNKIFRFFRKAIILLFVFLLFFSLQLSAKSDTTVVYGNVPTYANQKLSIKYMYDPITEQYENLGNAEVDSLGNFKMKFFIDKVYYGILDIGKLRGFIFLVPGKNYEITLPKYTPKNTEDLINPYFEPYEFYVKILNSEAYELNNSIHHFDFDFATFLDYKYRLINMQGIRADFDSIETYYNNKYMLTNSDFFKKYVKYNIYSIKSSVLTKSPATIFQTLLLPDYVDFQNPAFSDFFTQNFNNFFKLFAQNSAFNTALKNGNSTQILQIIKNKNWIQNEKMLKMAFLKGLYDAFYEKLYPQNALIALLTDYINNETDEKIRRIAGNILHQISKLKIGNPAPDFTLLAPDSLPYSLEDYRGYYVYLNFCTSSSFGCIQQYGLLHALEQKYLDSLKIVTIAADEDFEKTYEHFVKYRYRWDLLSFKNQPEILKEYEIRAYPSYFLIDPEGKLLWVPAPGPNEGFASRYYDFIRAIKIRDMKKKGNYDENYWK